MNRNLFHEVIERRHAEAMLQKAHNELEVRVKERTAELTEVNKALEREITERKQTADEIYLLREMILDISNSKDLHDALVITMQRCVILQAGFTGRPGSLVQTAHTYCAIEQCIVLSRVWRNSLRQPKE